MINNFLKPLLIYGIGIMLITVSISGCLGPEKIPVPDNLIPEDQYIDLMVEMQHIIIYHSAEPDSVDADSLKAIVYDEYDVTDEQYRASHEYYQKHVKQQIARVDSAIKRLEAEEKFIMAYIDSMKTVNAKMDSLTKADTTLTDQ
ncbi:MAG TPA: DUF4296 domain-containing protein [Gracilimonas sp.]|uniref:DUF4296 domain-containing protein n=1 Tax=Gracilimonas sp. TaxID=1974203 RepID=UPI002D83D34C|nr:DUF4296 domain-containing protein [Gracilimonas sp.]